MIKIDNINALLVEGKSQRSSKHQVYTDGNDIVIESTKFKDKVAMPINKVKESVKTVEQARVVLRAICKRQSPQIKYISSYQNVADKMYELLKAL